MKAQEQPWGVCSLLYFYAVWLSCSGTLSCSSGAPVPIQSRWPKSWDLFGVLALCLTLSALDRAAALLHGLHQDEILWRVCFSLPNSSSCCSVSDKEEPGCKCSEFLSLPFSGISSVPLQFGRACWWNRPFFFVFLVFFYFNFLFWPAQILNLNKTKCYWWQMQNWFFGILNLLMLFYSGGLKNRNLVFLYVRDLLFLYTCKQPCMLSLLLNISLHVCRFLSLMSLILLFAVFSTPAVLWYRFQRSLVRMQSSKNKCRNLHKNA